MKRKLLLVALAGCQVVLAQTSETPTSVIKPGVKEVQVPFASLKPVATFKVGETADWLLVTDDAVWVASTKPFSIQRIDPSTNKIVSKINITNEACSGLAAGFGSIWVPLCGKKPSLVRLDTVANKISDTLPFGPPGSEGGIAVSGDAYGSLRTHRARLPVSPQTPTEYGRKFPFRPVLLTPFSVKALSGSPGMKAMS